MSRREDGRTPETAFTVRHDEAHPRVRQRIRRGVPTFWRIELNPSFWRDPDVPEFSIIEEGA